jgi:hypothetical protein
MPDRTGLWDRRQWLQAAGLAVLGSGGRLALGDGPGPRAIPPAPPAGRKKVAAIVTTYHPRSHADHIVGRFLWGYFWQGRYHQPGFEVVSLHADQIAREDMSRRLAARFGFRTSPDVADALTLGSGKLAVDAVLLIGEHGNYPNNPRGQKLYPRFELFEQITRLFEASGRSVPVFNDKHLSYDHGKASRMVEASRRLKFPLMAGSSLPVTWRRPELELPMGTKIVDALVAAYGGDEVYGFHALETLQCMVERRPGGETGVAAVTAIQGQKVWEAGDKGDWSWDLLEHALGRSETRNVGDIKANVARPFAIRVEYLDGFKATVLLLNQHVADFTFAARVAGRASPESCLFALPDPPGANYFSSLAYRIEDFFTKGQPPYPVERTLLTGGILDHAFGSLQDGGRRVETPKLAIAYTPPADSGFARGGPSNPVS